MGFRVAQLVLLHQIQFKALFVLTMIVSTSNIQGELLVIIFVLLFFGVEF